MVAFQDILLDFRPKLEKRVGESFSLSAFSTNSYNVYNAVIILLTCRDSINTARIETCCELERNNYAKSTHGESYEVNFNSDLCNFSY